jgi:hypothetical protein
MLYAAVCATLVGGSVHTKGLLQKHIDHDTSDAGGVDVALKESADNTDQVGGDNYPQTSEVDEIEESRFYQVMPATVQANTEDGDDNKVDNKLVEVEQ